MRQKVLGVVVIGLLLTSGAWGENAQYYLDMGRGYLFDGSLTGVRLAYESFDMGIKDIECLDCQASRELHFFHAFSRLAMLGVREDGTDYNSILHLMQSFGVTVSGDQFWPNLLTLSVVLNNHDIYEIPPGAPGPEDFVNGLRNVTLPEIESILAELDLITDSPGNRFRVWLRPEETGLLNDLEVDYAEVLILKGLLLAAKAAILTDLAYDVFIEPEDINVLLQAYEARSLNITRDILEPYPDLGRVLPTPGHPEDGRPTLAQARQDFITGIDYFSDVVAYINAEDDPVGSDPQMDELLYIDPNHQAMVAMMQDRLAILRDNLANDTPVTFTAFETSTYALEDALSEPRGELMLVRDGFDKLKDGRLTLIKNNGLPFSWQVEHLTTIGTEIMVETYFLGECDLHYHGYYDLSEAKSLMFTPATAAPYKVTELEESLFTKTGAAQGWHGEGNFWSYDLPFIFTFYGVEYTTIYVCTNGFIDMTETNVTNPSQWRYYPRIMPLGKSLDTLNDGDIFIDDSIANQVMIRWRANCYNGTYNFAVVLFANGHIRFDYGDCVFNSQNVLISEGTNGDNVTVGGTYWMPGTLTGMLSSDSSMISNATFEFWGQSQDLVPNLNGERIELTEEQWTGDLNPLFGSSVNYPQPVDPRDLLPVFDDWNSPLPGTMGYGLGDDATLGGICPQMTQEQWQRDLDMQPAGEVYLNYAGPWGITLDGDLYDWDMSSLVFADPEGDVPPDATNQDIAALYMAFDWQYLYGAIELYEPIDPAVTSNYHLYLTYEPDESVSPRCLYALIDVEEGVATGYLQVELSEDMEYMWSPNWMTAPVFIDATCNGNVIEFRIPFELPPGMNAMYWVSYPGRFIHVGSSSNAPEMWMILGPNGDVNRTHLQIAATGSVSGTVNCIDWPQGNPIVVQAYTRENDPEGSIISSVVLAEPGPYTLTGVAEGWRGFIRAFTPVTEFSVFNLGALKRQAAVEIYMPGTHVQGVNLTIPQLPEIQVNVPKTGTFDMSIDPQSHLYRFEATGGLAYYFTMMSGMADLTIYKRNANSASDSFNNWMNPNLTTWTCPADGIYFLQVTSWPFMGGNYTVLMEQTVPCSRADLAGPMGFGMGDCKVNLLDFAVLAQYWLQPSWMFSFSDMLDFDGSDVVDVGELAVMAENWLMDGHSICPSGDFTSSSTMYPDLRDCQVDIYELTSISTWWLNDCKYPSWCGGGDINQDGKVNLGDFAIVAGQWLEYGPR